MLVKTKQEEKGMTEDEIVGITDSMDLSLSKLREIDKDREAWRATAHGVTQCWATEQLNKTTVKDI